MENNLETKPETLEQNKVEGTSQQDDAIASAKARVKAKYEKDIADNYVKKEDYKTLQDKYDALSAQVQKPVVENQLLKSGMKKEAVNDFLKLHPDAINKNGQELDALVAETKKTSGYMFDSAGFTASALPSNTDAKVEDKQKPMYSLDKDGFVITNTKH